MLQRLLCFFSRSSRVELPTWKPEWSAFLDSMVTFYQGLEEDQKVLFQQRVQLFLSTTRVESGYFDVTEEDRLLVAASAVIPVWKFPDWHYFNLAAVFLLPAPFNKNFKCGQTDSSITGMVGTGPMAGKMALSKPALYQGFKNHQDKYNVGIHEFVHLIDMADGECDGYPERLREHAYSIPWFELVAMKIVDIEKRDSNIRDYGATNRVEFFAVASEYFFERPEMLARKHPRLYEMLSAFYRQDTESLAGEVAPLKNATCPCRSGKKYKRCCMPKS